MVQLSFLLPIMLGAHIMSAAAVSCISDQSEDAQPMPAGPTKAGKKCLNGPPQGGLWACEDPKIDFPTVECLTADIKTCGIINANNAKSVFYSFGVDKNGIGALRDKINPGGNIYNNILDDNYWKRVMSGRKEVFRLDIRSRLFVFIARSAEAFSAACSGDVYVYVGQRQSKNGGVGAFQIPNPPIEGDGPNILRTYELPALQRNSAVTRIISVDVSNNFQQSVDWENGQSPPGLNFPLLPESPASTLPVPAVPAGLRKSRRDGNVTATDVPILCPVDAAALKTTAPASTSSSPASTITSPPAMPRPSCVLHEQDPDQGITQAFCLCDGSATLSPLSVASTGHQSDSCAYTAIPATAKETVTTVASTYTKNCQACTKIGLNAPSCKSITKCTPTAAQVTVQVGKSSVHVGTLTGTALYTSVSSALEKLCPSVTQTKSLTACSTDSVTVSNIDYVSANSLESGNLVIKVQAGEYNSTTIRDGMIKSAALTAQKGSERPSSCWNETYTTLVKRDQFPPSRIHSRRSGLLGYYARDHPEPFEEKAVFCNTAAFAGVGYFSPEWREAKNPGAEAFIDTTWEFKASNGGNFICNFLEDLEVGLAVVAPEFAIQDIALVPEIQATCQGILS